MSKEIMIKRLEMDVDILEKHVDEMKTFLMYVKSLGESDLVNDVSAMLIRETAALERAKNRLEKVNK